MHEIVRITGPRVPKEDSLGIIVGSQTPYGGAREVLNTEWLIILIPGYGMDFLFSRLGGSIVGSQYKWLSEYGNEECNLEVLDWASVRLVEVEP